MTSGALAREKQSFAEQLLWAAVATVPFQQALTLDVGVPLKISEILAGMGVVLAVYEGRRRVQDPPGMRLVAALAGIVVLSSIWTALAGPRTASVDAYPRGLLVDLTMYTAYALFALFLCGMLATRVSLARLASAIGLAVRLTAVYAAFQLYEWFTQGTLHAALGGTMHIGSLYGIALPRNGPFLEGNYLGFFVAVSLFVLARIGDRAGVVIAIALILYSQSTTAVLAVTAALCAILLLRPRARVVTATAFVGLASAIVVALVPQANRFVMGQLTKLGLVENTLGDAYGYSLRGRSANAETGFSMALGNPVLGVGQGRYAAHYDDYLDRTGLPAGFGAAVTRPIANNAYSQLAAETGLIALILFVALLILLLVRARADSSPAVGLVVALAVGLAASPSWTGLPVWVTIAIAMVAAARSRSAAEGPAQPVASLEDHMGASDRFAPGRVVR